MVADAHGNDDWALSVGIGEYVKDASLAKLAACDDARSFDTWVSDPNGGNITDPDQHTLIVSPDPQSQSLPIPVEKTLEDWFHKVHTRASRNVRAGSGFRAGRRLYLYFSGHGLMLGERPANDTVLLMSDAEPPNGRFAHFAARAWAEWLRSAAAFDEILLFMDCCRTSLRTVRVRTPPYEERTGNPPARHFYAFAVREGEAAEEIERRGALTSRLMSLLSDETARPLTASGLKGRLYAALPGTQRPDIKIPDDPDLDFLVIPGGRAPTTRAVATSALHVRCADALARLEVWGSDGTLVIDAVGTASKQVPHGSYEVRATIGSATSSRTVLLSRDEDIEISGPTLETPIPLPEAATWTSADREMLAAVDPSLPVVTLRRGSPWRHEPSAVIQSGGRAKVVIPADDMRLAIEVPTRPGFRTEVYADLSVRQFPEVAVRLVPSKLPVGEAVPTDRVRETLRAILQREGPGTRAIDASMIHGDPIAALLALACSGPNQDLLAHAADLLGVEDPDLIAWQGDGTIDGPPLLAASWSRTVAAGRDLGSHVEAAVANGTVNVAPWLAVSLDELPGWLDDLTAAVRREYLRGEQPTLPVQSIWLHRTKPAPLERLIRHNRCIFVGASNDQLPAWIVTAFAERERRPWDQLVVWSLDDNQLDDVVSAGRSGASLRRARDRAEDELRVLLPKVARASEFRRYGRFEVDGNWVLASLWDWDLPGGFIHTSPYGRSEEVRVARQVDLEWALDAPSPPKQFRSVIESYERLARPRRVAVRSGQAAQPRQRTRMRDVNVAADQLSEGLVRAVPQAAFWIPPHYIQPQAENVPLVADATYVRISVVDSGLFSRVPWFRSVQPSIQALTRLRFGERLFDIPGFVAPRPSRFSDGRVAMNGRLLELVPYRGGEIDFKVSLVGLPGAMRRRGIEALANISDLLSTPLVANLSLATKLGESIDLLNGDDARVSLSHTAIFDATRPIPSRYMALVAGSGRSIGGKLIVDRDELLVFSSAGKERPRVDYLLLRFEILAHRDDLRAFSDIEQRRAIVLGALMAGHTNAASQAYRSAIEAIVTHPELTNADRRMLARALSAEVDEIRRRALGGARPTSIVQWDAMLQDIEPTDDDRPVVADEFE